MSYRGHRIKARESVEKDKESLQPKRRVPKYSDESGSEVAEQPRYGNNNKAYNNHHFPELNKETRRNIPSDKKRITAATETRIPVAKRVRVPNKRDVEDPVTPVRERFRARHVENGKEFPKNKLNDSKRVTFYRNGDKYFKGRTLFVTKQRYRSFESLLEDLSRVIPLPYGVRNIFSSAGRNINSINELEDGEYYICSSGDQLIKNIDYENNDKVQNKTSNGLPEAMQNIAISAPSDSSTSSSTRSKNSKPKPKIITVLNQDRGLKCKILLNKKTAKNYEDILKDISEMLKLHGEHVQELHAANGGKVKVYFLKSTFEI